jgi:hypothetical protein
MSKSSNTGKSGVDANSQALNDVRLHYWNRIREHKRKKDVLEIPPENLGRGGFLDVRARFIDPNALLRSLEKTI